MALSTKQTVAKRLSLAWPNTLAARVELVRKLRARNWTWAQISAEFEVPYRTLMDYQKRLRDQPVDPSKTETEAGPPRAFEELAPEVQACLEDSPEGFERFFNRYSGLTLQRHSKAFVAAAMDENRWRENVVINVPPGHAKSTIFTVWMTLWRICQNRNFRRLIVSEAGDLPGQWVMEIAQEFTENPLLLKDFGRFKREGYWQPARGKLRVEGSTIKRGFNVEALGSMAAIQGRRCDEAVVDDVVSPDDVLTQARREKLSWWFHNVIESRPDSGGRIWVIGTRQHPSDLYGELVSIRDDYRANEKVWEHINFPAVLEWDEKQVLWDCEQNGHPHGDDFPKCCWTFERLMKRRAQMGSNAFEQTYNQQAIPEGAKLIKPEWVYGPENDDPDRGCLDRRRPAGHGVSSSEYVRVLSTDPSGGSRYGAHIVADVKPDRNDFRCVILDAKRYTGLHPELYKSAEPLLDTYRPSIWVVEKNLGRLSELDPWVQRAKRLYGFRLKFHLTDSNKSDLTTGVQSLGADFEYGAIRLPAGDQEGRQKVSPLVINEALAYPYGDTDDLMMSLWFIKHNLASYMKPVVAGLRSKWQVGWAQVAV